MKQDFLSGTGPKESKAKTFLKKSLKPINYLLGCAGTVACVSVALTYAGINFLFSGKKTASEGIMKNQKSSPAT